MSSDMRIDFLWIPADLGGHSSGPYSGMRLSIRWQRYIEAHLQYSRDVECNVIAFDSETSRGSASCKLSVQSTSPVQTTWLQEGELVELLSGFRVLAVGKIVSTQAITSA